MPSWCRIFVDEKLIGFAGATAHLIDVGAAVPGLNTDLIDVFGEGTLYNGIKLYRKGELNKDVWAILADSVRTPDMNAGDIDAMIAATRRGRDRFIDLIDRYGLETVMGAADHWMDYSERRLRDAISEIPDGDYVSESWLDNDGRNFDVPLKIRVTVRVQGDGVTIDLTGSADETATAFNVPFDGSLKVACYYAVRTLLLDQAVLEDFVPQNDGMFRPVTVEAPLGSIFNPRFPRACFARMAQCQRLIDCVIRALSSVIPERVTAGNAASVTSASYSGFDVDKGQYWVCVEVNEGSYGARATKDGLDTVDKPDGQHAQRALRRVGDALSATRRSVMKCDRNHPAPESGAAVLDRCARCVSWSTASFPAMATALSKRRRVSSAARMAGQAA